MSQSIEDDKDTGNQSNVLALANQPVPGKTLLPSPVASLISLATKSTSLGLRVGTAIGGFALNGARVGTLTGLELTRSATESILLAAGRDVTKIISGQVGKAEAEGILERSVATLHWTITSTSLITSTGFRLTSSALSSATLLCHHFLSSLDAVLGSTESSRAIAAIITLIRTEFQNSVSGSKDEKIGVKDLLTGGCGFAILQKYCWRRTDREIRYRGGEETLWDVVILDNGIRADVIGTSKVDYAESVQAVHEGRPESYISARGDTEPIQVVQRNGETISAVPALTLPLEVRRDWSEKEIRQYVMDQLPPDTNFAVRTETVTAKTITVDVFDSDLSEIPPPPGTLMIGESFHSSDMEQPMASSQREFDPTPKHTVVFQTMWNSSHDAGLTHGGGVLEPSRTAEVVCQEGFSRDVHESSTSDAEMPLMMASTTNGISGSPTRADAKHDEGDQGGKESKIPVPVPNLRENSQPRPQSKANQKRPRKPVSSSSSLSGSETTKGTARKSGLSKIAAKVKPTPGDKHDKKTPLKKALKKTLSPSQSTGSLKEMTSVDATSGKGSSPGNNVNRSLVPLRVSSKASHTSDRTIKPGNQSRKLPNVPSHIPTKIHNTQNLGGNLEPPRSSSRTSFYSVHEKRRDSVVTQTDTYSIHSVESRPGSPSVNRTHLRASAGLTRAKSEKDIEHQLSTFDRPTSRTSNHRRSKSYVPSIYSMTTSSQTSLVLASRPRKSVFDDRETILSMIRDGKAPGIFPNNHLVYNIRRFSRFSSAAYGSQFLHLMGIAAKSPRKPITTEEVIHHQEHQSFSTHTGLPPNAILLSPFVDPSGGSNAAGETASGVPLVYYLSLDHESNAVVLTFRGTLGFEDVLTDMTCDYDELQWQGKLYKVHKGMHASARRVLSGSDLMVTIKAALETSPDWGLILCGHSLGGGVAALVAILISELSVADGSGSTFVTKSTPLNLITNGADGSTLLTIPPRRPIHVYAYGPPATFSESLRVATRGLVTTVVNGEDVVPCLSLGVLRDFQSVAIEFKNDDTGATYQLAKRLWDSFSSAIRNRFYVNQPPLDFLSDPTGTVGEDDWAWAALKTLRACMKADKLQPPGEVFVVDTMPVLRRDAFTTSDPGEGGHYPRLGRPATRVQLTWMRNVEERFGEIRFGTKMLGDHSPGRYEASLAALATGVLED